MNTPTVGLNGREVREFACESKFLVTPVQAAAIEEWVRANFAADPHGSGAGGDCYQVSSLYFDTETYDVYHRIGSFGRSKYRVRRYDSHDQAFVERKTKSKSFVSKRRSVVSIEDLHWLEVPASAAGWPGLWFRRRLALRGLRPVCQISYLRTARIGSSEYGPYRITLDRDIRARSIEAADFAAVHATVPLLADAWILELKYRYTLPAAFRHLLAEFAPVPHPISKYRLAIEALELTKGDGARVQESVSEFAGS